MSSVDNHDRNWLAMQYVLGELSDNERTAFEERLPTDLELCEAVTAASHLLLTAQAARTPADVVSSHLTQVPTRTVSKSHRSLFAVVVATAAMALAVLLVVRLPHGSHQGANLVSNQNPQAAELVSLWQSGLDPDNEDSDDLEDDLVSAADVAVPSWMLAAVSIEAGATLHGPSDKIQEN